MRGTGRSAIALAAIALTGVALFVVSAAARRTGAPDASLSLPVLLILAPQRFAPLIVAQPAEEPPTRAKPGERVRVSITAYCLTGTTVEGRPVRPQLIAADPRVFPLGRYLDVFVGEEYRGRFYVGDTGRLVKRTVLDIWMPDCGEALRFGRRRGWAILLPEDSAATP
ncbi:MAG TPA: 3D domain-containing protein [Gemmatimonadaceae bacterium]|nr:3D domain-containing protein [Gemmatimonadaceae bacterium]